MKFKIIQNQHTPEVPIYDGFLCETEYNVWAQGYIDKKRELYEKFISFARTRSNCCGLAANQVEIKGERLLEPFFALRDSSSLLPTWNIYIFPRIIKYEGIEEEKLEGCLTWPNKTIAVKRYTHVVVEYYDLNGNFHNEKLDGFPAQIFQHEYDHLKGIEEKFVEKETLNNQN